MIVYIVKFDDGESAECGDIEGVFASEELAKDHILDMVENEEVPEDDYYIEVYNVNGFEDE